MTKKKVAAAGGMDDDIKKLITQDGEVMYASFPEYSTLEGWSQKDFVTLSKLVLKNRVPMYGKETYSHMALSQSFLEAVYCVLVNIESPNDDVRFMKHFFGVAVLGADRISECGDLLLDPDDSDE